MSIIEITNSNDPYFIDFLKNTFPSNFRYFNNKTPEQIIQNHYKTILYLHNNKSVGYSHIDYDIINDKYWLGICVISDFCGKGIGKILLNKIIEYFKCSNIEILYLTVDKDNSIAYNMYVKNGFKLQRETSTIYIMNFVKSNILYLPVSFGEAIDKLTILDIKMNKITDMRKIDVEIEYNKLNIQLKHIVNNILFYYNALKQINLQIWNDQDLFRESKNDDEKNILCKKIIEDNDARFRIKNKINNILSSFIKEQKGYNPKIYTINYSSDKINQQILNSIIKYQLIFNDKVIVICKSDHIDTLNTLFKNDISFEIERTLEVEPDSEYINLLLEDINNKVFFNFISSN